MVALKTNPTSIKCKFVLPKLAEYLDEVLKRKDAAAIAAHLNICPQCRAEFDRLVRLRDQLRSLKHVRPPDWLIELLQHQLSPAMESMGLTSIAGKLKLVSLAPDNNTGFLDPQNNLHRILFIAGAHTLELANAIGEFESLTNSIQSKEADFQKFFEDNPIFIIGDEYRRAHSHLVLQSESESRTMLIPDFVLEPVEQGGLADLLEVKLPAAKVVAGKQSRLRYSAAVMEACAQLREYSAFFDDPANRNSVHLRYGLLAYRPRLILLIGRRPNVDLVKFQTLASDLPNRILIRSYDELLARMRLRLDRLRGIIHPKHNG